MTNFTDLSLSGLGGVLAGYGVSFLDGDFWRGLILIGAGVIVWIVAAILKKHGYPVSKGKRK